MLEEILDSVPPGRPNVYEVERFEEAVEQGKAALAELDAASPGEGERLVLTKDDAELLWRFMVSGGAPNGTAWDDLWARVKALSGEPSRCYEGEE